jgi:hypothetical protein
LKVVEVSRPDQRVATNGIAEPTAYRDVERWTCAASICQHICKGHLFDETFGVNRAFNAELSIAALHAIAMEFDLFGERRSGHWIKGRRRQQKETSGRIARSRIAKSQA